MIFFLLNRRFLPFCRRGCLKSCFVYYNLVSINSVGFFVLFYMSRLRSSINCERYLSETPRAPSGRWFPLIRGYWRPCSSACVLSVGEGDRYSTVPTDNSDFAERFASHRSTSRRSDLKLRILLEGADERLLRNCYFETLCLRFADSKTSNPTSGAIDDEEGENN